jgi:hypothetical protein
VNQVEIAESSCVASAQYVTAKTSTTNTKNCQ